jgi:hypothetical protein
VFSRVVSQSLCCHGDILEGIFRNLFVAFWSNSQDDSWLKIEEPAAHMCSYASLSPGSNVTQ